MGNAQNIRRFRVNPVEFAIFMAVAGLFLHSVYNLFYDSQGFHSATVVSFPGQSDTEEKKGRLPSSVAEQTSPLFLNVNLVCEDHPSRSTTAGKVRLLGNICSLATPEGRNPSEAIKPSQVDVQNTANKFTATVFTDQDSAKYSTDYIPLNNGNNYIQVEFVYPTGKRVTQTLTIDKTSI